MGEMCHFVDLANHLVGRPPRTVFARAAGPASRVLSAQTLAATLGYADGSICSLVYLAVGDTAVPTERIEVFRGEASAFIDDFVRARLWRGRKSKKLRSRGRDKGHRRELHAFLGALRSGGAMPIPLDEIDASSRATFALLESLRTGRPVDLGRGGEA